MTDLAEISEIFLLRLANSSIAFYPTVENENALFDCIPTYNFEH
jgi:hypothetical protein